MPNGVTPPSTIPVSLAVSSAEAKDSFRTPRRSATAWFTSRRVVASTRHRAWTFGSRRLATRMALAESAGSMPYRAQNSAVSANAGSQASTSYRAPAASSADRTAASMRASSAGEGASVIGPAF